MIAPVRQRVVAAAFLALALPLAARPAHAQGTPSRVFAPEDFAKAFESVPCDDSQRFAAVQALFDAMGAPPVNVRIDAYDKASNLVVTKSGASPETIVIGAHYDKVAAGCGAIDNWTGVVVLAHLYQTLRDVPLEKTVLFVAFGREEKGLVGARAMTRALSPEQAAGYCAMINIDSLGLGPPQVADNMSSKRLAAFTGELATQLDIPFAHAGIGGADADSSAFRLVGIPAVTLHGLNNAWSRILHSPRDQPARINTASVYLGYRLALLLATRLDRSTCDAYR